MKSFLPRPARIPSSPLLSRWAPQGAGHVGVIDKQCACAEGVRRVCDEGGLLEEVACLSQRLQRKGESAPYSAITPREDPATRVRSFLCIVHLLPLTTKEFTTSIPNPHIAGWMPVQVAGSGGRRTFSTVVRIGTCASVASFGSLTTVTDDYALRELDAVKSVKNLEGRRWWKEVLLKRR